MTPSEKRYRARVERRLRRVERYVKVIAALTALTTLLAAWYVTGNAIRQEEPESVQQEAPQEVPRESSPLEENAPTEPLNAEEKAPRYEITQEELELVARVVHAEAGGEGYDGQALVAQCILNTAEATGRRPDEVVLAPKQYAAPAEEASDEVKEAVTAVFLDGYEVTPEPVRYFYAPARCKSTWHESALVFVLEHGGHRFFKK